MCGCSQLLRSGADLCGSGPDLCGSGPELRPGSCSSFVLRSGSCGSVVLRSRGPVVLRSGPELRLQQRLQ